MSVELENLLENLSLLSPIDSGDDNIPSNSQNINSYTNLQVNSEKINLNNMAQFKPEYLNCIPQFDGNPNELNRFLTTCESIINTFYDAANPNSFHNVYLLSSLIGKLTGTAKLIVNIQNVTTWLELKNTLYRNFADQRDEACLNRDLVLLRQFPNEKPQQFFDRCLQILNLLCSHVDIHENNDASKNLKRDLYNKLTLKTFLSGLKEPLGTTIRCMRPADLNQALQFIIQEENIQYYQNTTNKTYVKQTTNYTKPMYQSRPINNFKFDPTFNAQTHNHQFRAQNSFPSQPIQMRYRPNNPPQKFFRNSEVFKQNTNVFKPNQNQNLPKPTPMSTSTRQTFNKPWQRQQTQYQPQQKNFISEELFNVETDEIDETTFQNECDDVQGPSTYPDDYDNETYDYDVNFQMDTPTENQT